MVFLWWSLSLCRHGCGDDDNRLGFSTNSYLDLGDHRDDPAFDDYSDHDVVKVDTRLTVSSSSSSSSSSSRDIDA